MSQYEPTILVIDDEMGILDTLKILLKNSGFQVETAQGGNAGLEALNASCPDIVLTDVRMPDLGGIEILEKAHVVTTPGEGFGPAGQGFIRFSAFGHREDIIEATRRLKEKLDW